MNYKRKLQAGLVKPFRSKPYLDWVKAQECCGCGCQADEAHHCISIGLGGGMGTKLPDFPFTIPLCRKCHTELHADVEAWEREHGEQTLLALLTVAQALHDEVLTL